MGWRMVYKGESVVGLCEEVSERVFEWGMCVDWGWKVRGFKGKWERYDVIFVRVF